MRHLLVAALAGALWLCGGVAVAAPCFDKLSRSVTGEKCRTIGETWYRPKHDEVLANDEKGAPLFKAHVVPGKRKNDLGKMGIADMSGRLIAPAQFDKVYVISRTLGVGELVMDPKRVYDSQRAFLIDLKSGEIRPTPYRSIGAASGAYGAGTPYLLGVHTVEPGTSQYKVSVLFPTGAETGVLVENQGEAVYTHPHGLLGVGTHLFTARGEPPAGGRKIWTNMNWGYFAEIGPPPAEVGGKVGPLYVPLNATGQMQDLPLDVVGMVQGAFDMWLIKRTPQGLRFYRHERGHPLLAAPPAGEGYLGLYISRRSDVVKTGKGWMNPGYQVVFPTAEAAGADTDAKLDAFVAAVVAEDATRPIREAQQRAEAARAAEEAREVELNAIKARIELAKKEKWSGWKLHDLQRDVIRNELEREYAAAELYVSQDFKREVCWRRQSSICDLPPPPGASGSSFVSTWEQAFENARALNQAQGAANCAAALMGASRICTLP